MEDLREDTRIILKLTLKQQGQQSHATAAVTRAHILRTLTTISFSKKTKLQGINRTVTVVSHYFASLNKATDHVPSSYSGVPRNVFRGGVQQIQLRIEDREKGDLGAVAP